MTELEKLKQGLYYNSRSDEIANYNIQVKAKLHQ